MTAISPEQAIPPAVPAIFLYQANRPVTDDIVHYVFKYMFGPAQYNVVQPLELLPPPSDGASPDIDLPPPSSSEQSFLDSM